MPPPLGKGFSFEYFVRMAIGQAPKDLSLYEQALSNANPASRQASKRLAWQGDAVINMLATERILRDYPDAGLGRLAELRKTIVSRFNLARVAKAIGLDKHVQVEGGSRENAEVHAEMLEAFVGAAYFDTNSLQLARRVVDRPICEYEALVISGEAQPFLDIQTVRAGDAHEPTFQSTATSIFDPRLTAVATGTRTKRVSEQHAALEYMRTYGPVFMHRDKAGGRNSVNGSTSLPLRNTDVAGFLQSHQTRLWGFLKCTGVTGPRGDMYVTATSIFDPALHVTAKGESMAAAKTAAISLYFDTHGPVFKR